MKKLTEIILTQKQLRIWQWFMLSHVVALFIGFMWIAHGDYYHPSEGDGGFSAIIGWLILMILTIPLVLLVIHFDNRKKRMMYLKMSIPLLIICILINGAFVVSAFFGDFRMPDNFNPWQFFFTIIHPYSLILIITGIWLTLSAEINFENGDK